MRTVWSSLLQPGSSSCVPRMGACAVQDAKAFMVAWKGGRQVADVPRIKLNLPPGSWLGLTTAAGLAAALWWHSS